MQLLGGFEACLRDLKRLLAPTRKQILQSILILTIYTLKISIIDFCTSLIWQDKRKKVCTEAKFFWLSGGLSQEQIYTPLLRAGELQLWYSWNQSKVHIETLDFLAEREEIYISISKLNRQGQGFWTSPWTIFAPTLRISPGCPRNEAATGPVGPPTERPTDVVTVRRHCTHSWSLYRKTKLTPSSELRVSAKGRQRLGKIQQKISHLHPRTTLTDKGRGKSTSPTAQCQGLFPITCQTIALKQNNTLPHCNTDHVATYLPKHILFTDTEQRSNTSACKHPCRKKDMQE